MNIASTALGTALERKVFWLLDEQPMTVNQISQELKIPFDRTYSWLELLVGLGFLDRINDTYVPSSTTQSTILNTYKADSWAFLAQEARDQYLIANDLALHISYPHSVWAAQQITPPDWFSQIKSDMDYSRRFTRMLYDLHQNLAERLANILDLTGRIKLLDLGGGSGVISLALLRKYPELTALVLDIPSVCITGTEIAKENLLSDRITYHPADFIKDELPTGFDMIIECDVGVYTKELFQKIYYSLNPDGEFVIVANIDADSAKILKPDSDKPLPLLLNFFQSSLQTQKLSPITVEDITLLLSETGFSIIPQEESLEKMTLIRAKKRL